MPRPRVRAGRRCSRGRGAKPPLGRGRKSRRTLNAAGQGPHFHNLYGFQDWRLAGARGARRLGRHQGADRQGPRLDHRRRSRHSGLRGRGGAGFPTGLEMVVHADEADARPSYLVVNADESEPGILQGPRDHAPRSAPADRGRAARLLRHAGACLLHLRARRVHPRARAPAGGGRRGL